MLLNLVFHNNINSLNKIQNNYKEGLSQKVYLLFNKYVF